ncbi:response regulator [Cocleimonas sp. KMM 6892]|uniref:response regulator n=1 Tax=unclassified Cocleimonas TaxID=2639732 RepID=UPI002DBE70DC|nr:MULTISPECIES: response regulator [unclassified Cocleimonas]MEB8433718.1 response regulator [Cocleimonas sp. KMM 6892]MEC4716529.1 response regulator [Cocleimonas sp. KMM 6895]MEC4746316.1 response regulator [Cocleimonas sp. KMM 6896]
MNDTSPENETNDMNTEKSIGIHMIGLDARELAIFDRVVAFNITHGLVAHKTTNSKEADLIIVSQNEYPSLQSTLLNNKTVFLVSDKPSNESVDAQIQRPLLITKVMNALGEAIEIVKQKRLSMPAANLQEDIASEVDLSENVTSLTADHQTSTDTIIDNSITTLSASSETEIKIETEAESRSEKSHHALVIDDSASIRKQLELELRDAGVTSDFAESGEDALEKVKEGQFDLIFLDIIMPGIDGYETCKQIRAMAEYKKTPIIMLSGKTSPLDEVQGVIAGATTYLTKPAQRDKLQETLNRVTKWIDNFSQPKHTETV